MLPQISARRREDLTRFASAVGMIKIGSITIISESYAHIWMPIVVERLSVHR